MENAIYEICVNVVAPVLTPDSTFKDTLTMKSGTSTTVGLTLAAFPQPSVALTFNGGNVLDEKRISIKLADEKLSFNVQKVQKEDAGKYELVVENQHGKATATITIVVLGERTFFLLFALFNYFLYMQVLLVFASYILDLFMYVHLLFFFI